MFESTEPPEEWAALVPVVPPFDPADCTGEELAGWPGPDGDDPDGGSDDVLPDRVLVAASGDALAEFERDLEQARLDGLDADATLVEVAATGRQSGAARPVGCGWPRTGPTCTPCSPGPG